MTTPITAAQTLDREFLELRHRLLDLAAGFDRIDRGRDRAQLSSEPRMKQLIEGVSILLDGGGERTERIQMVFSDTYDSDWRIS